MSLYANMGVHVQTETNEARLFFVTKTGSIYSAPLGTVTTTPSTDGITHVKKLVLPNGEVIEHVHGIEFLDAVARAVLEGVGYRLFETCVTINYSREEFEKGTPT